MSSIIHDPTEAKDVETDWSWRVAGLFIALDSLGFRKSQTGNFFAAEIFYGYLPY
jgi:hypothetical protein